MKANYFRTNQPSKKLGEKNLGPYEIISTPGSHSFTLRLPQHFWVVHLVFHIAQLEPATPNPFPLWTQPPPPLVKVDRQIEFKVSEVLNLKWDCHFRGKNALQYLVCWASYKGTDEETTWIPPHDLKHPLNPTSLSPHHYLPHPPPYPSH